MPPFSSAFKELQIAPLPTLDNGMVATSISAVEASQPEQQRDYYLDMQEHVENRGFANEMDTFAKQYQNDGGINVPKGFVPT